MQTVDSDQVERPAAPSQDRLAAGRQSSWQEALGIAAFTLASSVLFLIAFEYGHYYRLLLTWKSNPGWLDRLLIAWTAWSASIVFLLPPLAFAWVIGAGTSWRAAWVIQTLAVTAIDTFLAVDLLIFDSHGRHLLSLLEFIGEPEALDFIGGLGRWLVMPAACMGVIGASAAPLAVLSRWSVGKRIMPGGPPRPRSVLVLFALLAILICAPLAIRNYAHRQSLFERTCAIFPVNIYPSWGLYSPVDYGDPILTALDHAMRRLYAESFPRLMGPVGPDPSAVFSAPLKPNVILIVLESLNYEEAVILQKMPKVTAWGQQGMVLQRHYSGSNHTESGLFTLLYARCPWVFHSTLDAGVPPQLCESFRGSGYERGYFSGVNTHWNRLFDFINPTNFEQFVLTRGQREYDLDSGYLWDSWDREALRQLSTRANADPNRPILALCFLNSSHMPYVFPRAYRDHPAGRVDSTGFRRDRNFQSHVSMLGDYRRALAFLDDEIAAAIAALDPTRNIIIVTGDHGESIYHDGTHGHYTNFSEAQAHVPLFIVGPGAPRMTITTATTHADVLPTLLHILSGRHIPIAGSNGRDLLAGPQPDEALLCSTRPTDPHLELLAIRGRDRLAFYADASKPSLRLVEFQNELANHLAEPDKHVPMSEFGWTCSAIESMLYRPLRTPLPCPILRIAN